jgi:hypothetical protein
MATTLARQPVRRVDAHPRYPRWFRAWAITTTVLLGLLFIGVTLLTVALWATDPADAETGPVVDLAFFALGGVLITGGIASQVRRPRVAGVQQAVLALSTLAAAGLAGGRIEPTVGALGLLAATSPLILWHPDRRRLWTAGGRCSRPLLVLVLTAAAPATTYAVTMLARARAAGPSCFLGRCALGDRYAEAAALAIAVVLVALLAALRTDGWRLPAWCAGIAAIVLGATSLLLPAEGGAVVASWAIATLVWGAACLTVATVRGDPPCEASSSSPASDVRRDLVRPNRARASRARRSTPSSGDGCGLPPNA